MIRCFPASRQQVCRECRNQNLIPRAIKNRICSGHCELNPEYPSSSRSPIDSLADRQMSRPQSLIFLLICVALSAGCQYDGSTLQMNSDSPSPFLGLQWSVRNDKPRGKPADVPVKLVRADYGRIAETPRPPETNLDNEEPLLPDYAPAHQIRQQNNLTPTSDQSKSANRVRYSLERTAPASDSNLADELTARLRRF